MAVPKRKMSRSNIRHRRAPWKAATPRPVPITVGGATHLVPQRPAKSDERGLLRPGGCTDDNAAGTDPA
ncbi:50S ribosomal protein L32 [Streptomyces sp. NPDC057963]|uniref:50S ribosomal protein L32 n=1 Tax=Streptomyces sp. NPDC057963 TaxID=3346290 RepID=UPI0036E632B4